MVRRQQNLAIGHLVAGAVLERIGILAREHSSALQVVEVRFKSNPAQRDDHPDALEPIHFAVKIWYAVGQLFWQRLVLGWCAADRRGDVEVLQFKTIVAIRSIGLIGESGFMQDWIHEFAGGIAGEWAPGAV